MALLAGGAGGAGEAVGGAFAAGGGLGVEEELGGTAEGDGGGAGERSVLTLHTPALPHIKHHALHTDLTLLLLSPRTTLTQTGTPLTLFFHFTIIKPLLTIAL